ncbi:MAG: aminoacyl-tRNA hydrolase [Candidatus Pacebacteria bacterium]|nr:aminoacyl-tRNA hydrolase [Candidatus Paceibacterota bacterium]MCF7862828.1 aminoacyl-tRNA hydrolase [Candidatus Paceibacterota bacterium]
MKIIVGLGNIGEEYLGHRHNAGFIVLDYILGKKAEWKEISGGKLLYVKDSLGSKQVQYIKPTTFMNNSGTAVAFMKEKNKLTLKDIVVIYDDIDLPLGKIKISFDKSSGGHNGLESIIKKLKSKEFVRIRVGVCPTTPLGKMKKPQGEEKLLNFLLGDFKKEELDQLKKVSKKIAEALEMIFNESKEKAMSLYN